MLLSSSDLKIKKTDLSMTECCNSDIMNALFFGQSIFYFATVNAKANKVKTENRQTIRVCVIL
jgi:hypothetical protein